MGVTEKIHVTPMIVSHIRDTNCKNIEIFTKN